MAGINSKYPSPLIVSCPKCGNDIKLYTHHKASIFSCGKCNTFSTYNRKKNLFSNAGSFIRKHKATFVIGTVFNINGSEFVLVNYTVKEETKYHTTWIEYTLFNPVEGFWTLSQSDGHYSLLKPTNFHEESKVESHPLGNFQLYSKYKYKVKYMEGEFFTNTLDKLVPHCKDYVCPPYVLSYEETQDNTYWYEGEYVNHKTLKSWLQKDIALPVTEGIAPNQPFALNFKVDNLMKLTIASVLLLLGVQFFISSFVTVQKTVSNQTFFKADSVSQRTYVSESFDVTKNNCAVGVEVGASLDNSWLETNFALVNETTGEQYYFSTALERYYGVEDGESWVEGNSSTEVIVNQVKKGRYHYNVSVTNGNNRPFGLLSIVVKENVPLTTNYYLLALCLVIFPIFIYFRRNSFNKDQWYNSDYSPYHND